jgi:hypothetical protein
MSKNLKLVTGILFAIIFALPGDLLNIVSKVGTLPYDITKSGQFMPSTFQAIWLVLLAWSALIWKWGCNWNKALFAASFMAVLAIASKLIGIYIGVNNAEAWMPMASASIVLLALSMVNKKDATLFINIIMLANLLTIPLNLLYRVAEGNYDFRLNPFGLNANASGMLFAIWYFILERNALGGIRLNERYRRFVLYASAFAVIFSGSRTALFMLAINLLIKFKRTVRFNVKYIGISIVLVALTAIFLFRSLVGTENHGSYTPPEELSGSVYESFGALGRAWSILVGFEVLNETGIYGTQSVGESIDKMQDKGYPTFSHSTILMLVILYGLPGLIFAMLSINSVMNMPIYLHNKLMIVLMFAISGGLLTNPKEIAMYGLLLCLRERQKDGFA